MRMKAAVIVEQGQSLAIEDLVIDRPGPHEVLIRTVACGLCHSDLHFIDGAYPHALPAVPGHEAAGIVEAVGSHVSRLKKGDALVTCLSAFCGTCEFCVTGRMALCLGSGTRRSRKEPPRLARADGTPVQQMLNLSALAEMMLVHENACVAIRPDMPLDRAALLGCAVTTGAGTVFNACKLTPGESVAVIGCGGVGLAAVNAARGGSWRPILRPKSAPWRWKWAPPTRSTPRPMAPPPRSWNGRAAGWTMRSRRSAARPRARWR
jgi:S-(hydroxymethyl)glutathione dehydrogenase/alcohol dehydrogenase